MMGAAAALAACALLTHALQEPDANPEKSQATTPLPRREDVAREVDLEVVIVAAERHLRDAYPTRASVGPRRQVHMRPVARELLDQEDERGAVEVRVPEPRERIFAWLQQRPP